MMTKAWRIREWDTRYEVDDKGRAWKGKGKKRVGSLDYIRFPAWGYDRNKGYRRLVTAARTARRLEAAMCLWPKLLQLAADNDAEHRGWLLGEEGQPAGIQDFVYATAFRPQTVVIGLEVLSDPKVRWIEQAALPDIPGHSRKLPETPGLSPQQEKVEQTKPEQEERAREDEEPAVGGAGLPPAAPQTTDDDPGAIMAFRLEFFKAFPPSNPARGSNLPGWSTRGADSHRGWAKWVCEQPPNLLRSITAADLSQAKRWGDEKKWGWGAGTLIKYLEQKKPPPQAPEVPRTRTQAERWTYELTQEQRQGWFARAAPEFEGRRVPDRIIWNRAQALWQQDCQPACPDGGARKRHESAVPSHCSR